MKKFIVFALMWVLCLVSLFAIGKESSEVITTFNPEVYFYTLATFAGIIIPVTSFLNKEFRISIPWVKQLLSWIVSLVLGLIAVFFDWGIFVGAEWYIAIVYCLAAGLIANGIFDIVIIRSVLKAFGLEPK